MKKVLSICAVALVATMVSCGPSAEDKKKMEERATFMADSMKAAMEAAMTPTVAETPADTTAATTATTEVK